MTTAQNEYGTLQRVLLKKPSLAQSGPGESGGQWRALGYRHAPDSQATLAEFDSLTVALDDSGIEIGFIDAATTDTLDAKYVRDASIISDRGAVLCNMGKAARAAEPAAHELAYTAAGIPVLGRIEAPGHLEGGDLIWLDERTLAVGLGYRSNAAGVAQLRTLLGETVDEIITVPLPHWRGADHVLHLMSLISPVDRNLAVVYSPLMPVPFRDALCERGIELVEVPDDEFDSLGSNVLALAPRRCLMVAGNPLTRKRLEAAGAGVTEFDGRHLCLAGDGGPTCLTRPLLRQSD